MTSNEKQILEIAKWMIENQATMQAAADHFNKSKSSIQKYMNKQLVLISPETYKTLKETQELVLKRAPKIGGKIGRRSSVITDFEALEMATYRISTGATYEELSRKFGYVSSSIQEAIMRLSYEELAPLLEQVNQDNLRSKTRGLQSKVDEKVIQEEKIGRKK